MPMTPEEIATAEAMLESRADRIETMIEGSGQCLTVYWISGGQRIFYSLDEVTEHIETHEVA